MSLLRRIARRLAQAAPKFPIGSRVLYTGDSRFHKGDRGTVKAVESDEGSGYVYRVAFSRGERRLHEDWIVLDPDYKGWTWKGAQRSYEDESMDAVGANEPDIEQTLAEGTKVRFNLGRNISAAEFDDQEELVTKLEGTVGTVVELATATELGQRDYEYYDVKFGDDVLLAISGLHLTPVQTNKWKWKGAGLRTASTTWEDILRKHPDFQVPQVGDTVKHPSGLEGVVTRVIEKDVYVKMSSPVPKEDWPDLCASRIHSTPEVLDIYAGDGFLYSDQPWRVVRNTWKWKGAQAGSVYPVDTQVRFNAGDMLDVRGDDAPPELAQYDGRVGQITAHYRYDETDRHIYYDVQFPGGFRLNYVSGSRLTPINTWRWKGPPDTASQDNS